MTPDEYILFSTDDLLLCAVASSVHGVHDGLITQKEAGTHPWFLGLAVVGGQLLPVTDLGSYYGKRASSGRVIEIAHQFGRVGLQVDEVHGVSKEVAGDYQLIDIAQLVQSEKFLNIQCESA